MLRQETLRSNRTAEHEFQYAPLASREHRYYTASICASFDANGNLISTTDPNGTTSYTWDVENRLASVALPAGGGTVTYQYDPFGRRIDKISPTGTTIYAYDGDNVVEELEGSGTAVARYTQGLGIDEPLAMYRGGASYYYNADGLGSITSLTDASGQIAANSVTAISRSCRMSMISRRMGRARPLQKSGYRR